MRFLSGEDAIQRPWSGEPEVGKEAVPGEACPTGWRAFRMPSMSVVRGVARSWRHRVAAGLALVSAVPCVGAEIIAGPFVSPVNAHVYYLLGESSWQDAEAFAVRLGGHLATLRSDAEQGWVFDRFGAWAGQFRSLWIGLRRVSPGGPFAWTSGEPVPYTHWLPGQPDNSPVTGGEAYVHLLNTGNAYGHPGGYWNDLASPNVVFTVFDPVCGVVEIVPSGDPEVRLTVESDAAGARVTAATPATSVRVVWEASPTLTPPSWSVVAVESDVSGRATWSRLAEGGAGSGFLRVRAHDTPGFNARLDQVIRRVRVVHPDAVLLESSPVLSGWVTGWPEASPLRAVLRVAGGTVVAEQGDPWGDPSISFRAAPWLGDMDLPWPVAMNLEEAESELREAGYGSEYKTLTLRQPVYPGMTEPYFIFGTPSHGFVFVGTTTRKVFVGN